MPNVFRHEPLAESIQFVTLAEPFDAALEGLVGVSRIEQGKVAMTTERMK